MELYDEIELTCKRCGETQKYHPRGNKIPKRPKTQCQNEKCGAWIYFDGSLLVKDDQKKTKNDQRKKQKKSSKTKQNPTKIQKPKEKLQSKLTKKDDQRPKDNDQMTKINPQIENDTQIEEFDVEKVFNQKLTPNQIQELIKIYHEIHKEFQSNNKLIPLHKKMELINWLLKDLDNLYDGVYNYLRIWKTRYYKRLEKSPDSPVIPKFESMQSTLEKIKEIKALKEKKTLNPQFKKESET